MDIRKFFGGGAKPTSSTSTTSQPNPTPTKGSTTPSVTPKKPTTTTTTKPKFDLGDSSDDDDIIVVKSTKKMNPHKPVQLAPPKPLKDVGGPRKSDRNLKKRGRKNDDDSYSSNSSSSSSSSSSGSSSGYSSDSSSSSVSGSESSADSFFGESDFEQENNDSGPKKSNRAISKRGVPTRGKITNDNTNTTKVTKAPAKSSSTTTTTTTTTTEGPKKTIAKKKPAANTGGGGALSSDWDYSDIAIDQQPLPPAPKFVTDASGRQVPIWIAAQQAPPPPPYRGLRSRPVGRSDTFATGGGGPNGKNREKSPLTFVLSGVLKSLSREDCEDLIKSMGGKCTGAPSGRTDFIIIGDEPGPSKVNKGVENGTWFIDEDGLFKLIIKKNPNQHQPAGLMLDEIDDAHGGLPRFDSNNRLLPARSNNNNNDNNNTPSNAVNTHQESVHAKTMVDDVPPQQTVAAPTPAAPVAPVAPIIEAPKKGSLYAKKAPTTTTTTTGSLSQSSLSLAPTITGTPTQSLTQTQSLPATQSALSSTTPTTSTTLTPKPSLYSRKTPLQSTSSGTASTTATTTTATTNTTTVVDPNLKIGGQTIQRFDPRLIDTVKISEYPGTTENDLWVDRFKPQNASEICGNNTAVSEITQWLNNWQDYLENDMFEGGSRAVKKLGRNDDGAGEPIKRAILLSGGPGIGKTTAALLCAKAAGLTPIEFNASDTRSQKAIQAQVGVLSDNKTLSSYFGKKDNTSNTTTKKGGVPRSERGTGSVIIMDEVDGASANDRGGVAELIKIIKTTNAPVICICNDARSTKVKSLKNYCKTYTWQRPRAQQIVKRLQSIALSQGLKLEDSAIEQIYKQCNNDIRSTMNYLQMLHYTRKGTVVTYDDARVHKAANTKDMETSPFEVVASFFHTQPHGPEWFNQLMVSVYQAEDLLPLFMYENYLRAIPASSFGQVTKPIQNPNKFVSQQPKSQFMPKLLPSKKNAKSGSFLTPTKPFIADFNTAIPSTTGQNTPAAPKPPVPNQINPLTKLRNLSIVSHASDAHSIAQQLNFAMMDDQAFHLWNYYSAMGVIYPGQAMGGGFGAMVNFPLLLGKISSANKALRVGTLFRSILTIISTPLSRKEIVLGYLPALHKKVIQLILGQVQLQPEQIRSLYGQEYCHLFRADKYVMGIESIAHLLSYLGMLKDDFDTMIEFCDQIVIAANNALPKKAFPNIPKNLQLPISTDVKSPETYSAMIKTATKSALTRTMTKLNQFKSGRGTGKIKGDAGPTVLTEEQLLEQAEHELELSDNDDSNDNEDDDDDQATKTQSLVINTTPAPAAKKTTTGAVKRQKPNNY